MTMIVRGSLRESANQLRLFGGYKCCIFKALIHFRRDEFAHLALACAAIKIAAIPSQNIAGPRRASIDCLTGLALIDVIADANDHENQ